MRDTLNLVDSEDAWEVAEMSGRCIAAQQDVAVRVDSEDGREVAEMIHAGFTLNHQFLGTTTHQRHVRPSSKDLLGALGYCLRKDLHLLSRDNVKSLYKGIIGRIESGIHALESICCLIEYVFDIGSRKIAFFGG
jgi:hypothetical protein